MEALLNKILEGQSRTDKKLDVIQGDIREMKGEIQEMKGDIKTLKASVHRIEVHQEQTIVATLGHIKKAVESRDNKIEVLNKRLFEVESKVEEFY